MKKFSAKFKKSKQRNSEGYKIGVFTGYYLEGLLFSKLFSSKPEKNSQLNIRRVSGFSCSRWLPIEGIKIFQNLALFDSLRCLPLRRDNFLQISRKISQKSSQLKSRGQFFKKVQKSRLLAGYHLEGLLFSKKFGSNVKKVPN